jgi:hypothetical protein
MISVVVRACPEKKQLGQFSIAQAGQARRGKISCLP